MNRTLTVENLSYRIHGKPILRNIDCEFAGPGFFSVIGPNGAGKSHLLKALAGLLKTEGDVKYNGQSMLSLTAWKRGQFVSWLEQGIACEFAFSVFDTVMMGRFPRHRGYPSLADKKRVEAELEYWGLKRFSNRHVLQLSQGEVQKTYLARSFVNDCPVILLDEPDTNLDVGNKLRVFDCISEKVRRGHLVVCVMHGINDAISQAEYMISLKEGAIANPMRPTSEISAEELSQLYGVSAKMHRSHLTDERWVQFQSS